MLILSRFKDEAILIGNGVRIVVTEIRGEKVRLGIEAPEHVVILREELARPDDTQEGGAK